MGVARKFLSSMHGWPHAWVATPIWPHPYEPILFFHQRTIIRLFKSKRKISENFYFFCQNFLRMHAGMHNGMLEIEYFISVEYAKITTRNVKPNLVSLIPRLELSNIFVSIFIQCMPGHSLATDIISDFEFLIRRFVYKKHWLWRESLRW